MRDVSRIGCQYLVFDTEMTPKFERSSQLW
jgi:hypothetical protein